MSETKPMCLTYSTRNLQIIDEEAEEAGRSRSSYITRVLKAYIKKKKKKKNK